MQFTTDSSFKENILYPDQGFSKYVLNKEFPGYIRWLPFDGAVSLRMRMKK